MRRLLAFAVLVVAATAAATSEAAADDGKVNYRPPVDAPITDHFRKPEHNWNAGNRGIDYGTAPGTPVRAAADGEVTFAGQVGDSQHVVVLHADGLRTSYSFLSTIAVHRGDHVAQGDVVGTSGDSLHFGVRKPDDTYVDPETLFAGNDEVHLVPESGRRARSAADERAGVVRLLAAIGRGSARATAAGVGWAAREAQPVASAAATMAVAPITTRFEELRGVVHYAVALQPCIEALAIADGINAWNEQRGHCTPESVPAPRVAGRHRVVLVGGLGSASGHAAVLDVPTDRLGYAPNDVMQFSYRGGTAAESPYAPADTEGDLRASARRLRELLDRLAREDPAVPVDVIAHSQGGLVTRAALAHEVDRGDGHLPPLGAIVTLGSPHKGADLATAVGMLSHPLAGRAVLAVARQASSATPDPGSPAVQQLSETSDFVRGLNERPVPKGVRVTSIAGRSDLVVPAPRSRLAGASNVTVSARDHDALPRSAAAEREMALALSGMPPTCQGFGDAMADTVIGSHISKTEDALGAGLWGAARTLMPLPVLGEVRR
jgi:murein DD-endopeptidase MepM/ murein hydrolase activator NlpD